MVTQQGVYATLGLSLFVCVYFLILLYLDYIDPNHENHL